MKGNIKLHVRPKDRLVKDVLILNYCSGWNRLDRSIIGKVYADCDRFRQSAGLFLYQKMIYGLAGTGLDDTGRQTEMKSGNHGFAPGYNLQSTESLNTGDSLIQLIHARRHVLFDKHPVGRHKLWGGIQKLRSSRSIDAQIIPITIRNRIILLIR